MPRGTNSRPGHGLRRPDRARRRARASKCLQFPVLFGVSHASIVEAELHWGVDGAIRRRCVRPVRHVWRSEEHTSELQSLMRISYAVFCLKKKTMPPTLHASDLLRYPYLHTCI